MPSTRATSPTGSSTISGAISRILSPRSSSNKHLPGQDDRRQNKVSSTFVFLFVDSISLLSNHPPLFTRHFPSYPMQVTMTATSMTPKKRTPPQAQA